MIIPNEIYINFYQVLKTKFLRLMPETVRSEVGKTDVNFWHQQNEKKTDTYFAETFLTISDPRHFYKKYRSAVKNPSYDPIEKDDVLIDILIKFLKISYPSEIENIGSKDPDLKAAILFQVFLESYAFTYLIKYPSFYIYDRHLEKFRWESNNTLSQDDEIKYYTEIRSQLPINAVRLDAPNEVVVTSLIDETTSHSLRNFNTPFHISAETSIVELKTRRNFDRFENIVTSAEEDVIVTGTNFDGVLNMHERINALVKKGVKFRFLALDPYGRFLKYSSEFSNVDFQKRKKKIINNLELLRDEIGDSIENQMVEMRVYDGFASTGHIALDVNSMRGKIIVQHYLYANPADFAPLFTLDAASDHFWYNIYKRQLEMMWEKSSKI